MGGVFFYFTSPIFYTNKIKNMFINTITGRIYKSRRECVDDIGVRLYMITCKNHDYVYIDDDDIKNGTIDKDLKKYLHKKPTKVNINTYLSDAPKLVKNN